MEKKKKLFQVPTTPMPKAEETRKPCPKSKLLAIDMDDSRNEDVDAGVTRAQVATSANNWNG